MRRPVFQGAFALPGELVVDSFAGGVACPHCGGRFAPYHNVKKYCSDACRVAAKAKLNAAAPERPCRTCGTVFIRSGRGHSNKQHCSGACAAASARRTRKEFDKRNPGQDRVYRERQRAKKRRDTSLQRLWRKHPEVPRCCEACGESRVLDIAHRPEFQRRGAWKTMENTSAEKVWVLCPLCHALLDRVGYTPEQLGIRPRPAVCPDVAEALVRANVCGAVGDRAAA